MKHENFSRPSFAEWLRRAARRFTATVVGAERKSFSSLEAALLRGLDADRLRATISEPLREHAWVHACLTTIARKVASVPFVVASRARDARGDRAPLPETHPAARLFAEVNPRMSRSELWQATVLYLYLRGEALWLLETNERREPLEIWAADPADASPLVSPEGALLGWKIRGRDGKEAVFAEDETVRFRFFNPADPMRGLSPLEPARMAFEQDFKAARHNEAVLDNAALPGGFVRVPETVAPEAFERLRAAWEASHSGPARAGRIAWLAGGMEFSPSGLSMKDLDFIEGRRFNREEILAVFGTPPAEVQVFEFANYANAREQGRKFWHNTLIPLLVHFEEVLEAKLFRRRFPDAVGYFDVANVEDLQDNLESKSQVAERFFRMGVPFADVNERLQLGFNTEGKPWMHEGFLPSGMVAAFRPDAGRRGYALRAAALSALAATWKACAAEQSAAPIRGALDDAGMEAFDAARTERAVAESLAKNETFEQAKERVRELFR